MRNKVLSFLFVFVFALASPASTAGLNNQKAPEFTLQDIYGKTYSLGDFKGKVVFLDFWASWCPPCKKEFPEMESLSARYEDSDLVIIAISVDKKRSHVDGFLARMPKLPKNFFVLLDPESSVIKTYNAIAMPTSFILDRSGTVRHVHYGFRESDPKSWIDEIEGLLNQKE